MHEREDGSAVIERGTLRDYQVADLVFHMQGDSGGNLSDPGTGKTPTVCAWMYWLWTTHSIRTFWTMPKSLMKKNLRELLKFSGFNPEDVVIYDGNPKQRQHIRETSKAKVWIMGFNRYGEDWAKLLEIHPDFNAVCVDEFHMGFGGWNSGRTQSLVASCRRLQYFLPMTGTLVDGRLDSVYPAIHIIEPRYYSSYENFLKTHEVKDYLGKRIGWTGHEKIRAILGHHCIRRTFEMVYGVEKPVIQVERVDMGTKQRAIYDKFEKEAMIELEDRFIRSGNGGPKMARLRSIMEHGEAFRDTEAGEVVDLLGGELSGKDERLLIHLANHWNSGKPLVIFSALIPALKRIAEICRKFGFRVGEIHGEISTKVRDEVDGNFCNGLLDVIVVSPACAAVGYNWGHVDHAIFYCLDYKDTNFDQAYKRFIRGLRSIPLLLTVLEYERSMDQRVFQIVVVKSEDANLVDPSRNVIDLSNVVVS